MGCWNKTCGVTQFPIFAGDQTVNFVLVESWTGSKSRCYSHDGGWFIVPMPIYGEYNDYGWQDDDDGQQPKYDFLAKYFAKELVENEAEKGRVATCYPPMKKGPFENNEILGNSIHGDAWHIRNRYGKDDTLALNCFMVSRKVWDALTSTITVDYPKKRTYTVQEIAEAITAYQEYLVKRREQLFQDLTQGSTDQYALHMAARTLELSLFSSYDDFIKEKYPKEDSYGSPIRCAISMLSLSALDNGFEIPIKDLLVENIITPLDAAAFCIFHNSMAILRKTYAPQTGEGSQSGFENEHLTLIKVMQDMIKDYEKYCAE